jgi:hypothetical protein
MRVTSWGALALTSLALLAGCGDGPTPPKPKPSAGNFTATVSGAASKTLSGEAGFVVTPNTFSIALSNSSGVGYIQFSRLAGIPAVGTYQLDANAQQNSGVFGAIYSGGAQENYVSSGGTLTVATSSADRVTGSFAFTGLGGTSGTATVTITGSFDAPRLSGQ